MYERKKGQNAEEDQKGQQGEKGEKVRNRIEAQRCLTEMDIYVMNFNFNLDRSRQHKSIFDEV